MPDNFQKRQTAKITPAENIEHQVRFETQRFNSLVFDKGYEVFIDRAYKCPCAVKGSGQPLPTCDNCLGLGWIFTNRIETRVAIQGIKADVKYENWTKTSAGIAKITARAIDKLAFMDRIILKDVEGYYNEILRTKTIADKKVAYSEYPIIEIEELYLFNTDKTPLIKLVKDVDYTIVNESKIEINDSVNAKPDFTLTIRYRHYLTYHVIDMNRDITKVREKGCVVSEEQLKAMPISGTLRKDRKSVV